MTTTTTKTPVHPAIKEALLYLSGNCDEAAERDGIGFNGVDTQFGKDLAAKVKYGLSTSQQQSAQKMLRKYATQLKGGGIKIPTVPELASFLEMLTIEQVGDTEYQVTNELKGTEYHVTFKDGFGDCDCPLHQQQDLECKHIAAVRAEYNIETDPEPVTPDLEPLPEPTPDDDEETLVLPPAETARGLLLNEQQRRAIALIQQWFDSEPIEGKPSFFLLEGAAGTGKTFTLQEAVHVLRQESRLFICMCAPTNKAVKVLVNMAANAGLRNIDFCTIYQLLGLKLEVDDDGKEKVTPDLYGAVGIHNYDLIVCDEASMIDRTIWKTLNGVCRGGTPKMLFMGDSYQLPPIGEHESKVFDIEDRAALTQVMRFGSVIGELVTKVRENIASREPVQPYSIEAEDSDEQVSVVDRYDWLDMLVAEYKSDAYKLNPDHVRALAWTNKVVAWINNHVHTRLHGLNAPQFVVGERLIAIKPVMVESMSGRPEIAMTTSSECTVFDAERSNSGEYTTWKLWLDTDGGRRIEVTCIDDESRNQLIADLDALAQQAYALKRGTDQCKAIWRRFYALKQAYAPLQKCYAITVHKAQGSTFNQVFVAQSDLLRNNKALERNQLQYVAYSRAAQKLVISE